MKQEDLTTWQDAAGDSFYASLDVEVEIECRSGKLLEAMFIQRYIAPKYPDSKLHTMQSTFRAHDTMMAAAGWENSYDELSPIASHQR